MQCSFWVERIRLAFSSFGIFVPNFSVSVNTCNKIEHRLSKNASLFFSNQILWIYTHSFSPIQGFVTGELDSSCSRLGIKARVILVLTSSFSSRSAFVESILAVRGAEVSLKWTKKITLPSVVMVYILSFWEK